MQRPPSQSPPEAAHVYAVVRLDLPQPVRTVQVAHAAIAATFAYGEPHRTHPNLVVCGVADEAELRELFNRLKDQGVPCVGWHEEDLGGSLTAVATGPLRGDGRRPLRRLRLLKD